MDTIRILIVDDQTMRETVYWTPPELEAPTAEDGVNSSLCHGFIFDFCGIEIDPETAEPRIDRYVTMHDCGRILHPAMVDGQVRGGFAQAVGAAFLEATFSARTLSGPAARASTRSVRSGHGSSPASARGPSSR